MRRPQARRLVHTRPDALLGLTDATPDEMRGAFDPAVARLIKQQERGASQVAVQGQISSMKSWLLTCTAEEVIHRNDRVAALAPQRVNRRSLVDRLDQFDVPYIELPSRRDLCTWEAWLESVGRVDERTCSTNGCPRYPQDRDMEELARAAIAKHVLTSDTLTRLDEAEIKRLAATFDPPVCPHYLLDAVDELIPEQRAVRVATHAKALAGDARGAPESNVLLVDESHTVGAATDLALTRVDVQPLAATLRAVCDRFLDSAHRRVARAGRSLEPLACSLEAWEKASHHRPVAPDELFTDTHLTITDAFDAIEEARGVLINKLRIGVQDDRESAIDGVSNQYYRLQEVTDFLSRIVSHREGAVDFIHTRYQQRGVAINDIAFRAVDEQNPSVTPAAIYEAWKKHPTHPAIDARWGGLLDHHIEAIWSGRETVPGGERERPGVPPTPMQTLRETTSAETVVGYSATHNELSDPARQPTDCRETAHELFSAPVYLRTDGDTRDEYNGRRVVSPETPWFKKLVKTTKAETGARLAAVPINSAAATYWDSMPVESLTLPDGAGDQTRSAGLVPHSRAAIGDKDLESLAIDAVLCGVQVQSPADTARRLIGYWELLSGVTADATEALERGWRLLAQHAVTGTIQAAGRFNVRAPNIVFERPGLIELAGFEVDPLTPSAEGFAGAFARHFEEIREPYQRERLVVQAKRTIGHLEGHDTKQPTKNQYLSKYAEMYGATKADATEAFLAAEAENAVKFVAGSLRVVKE